MTTTAKTMRQSVSKEVGSPIIDTTTAAGEADGSTLVCSALAEYEDDALKDKFVLVSGARRKIKSNTSQSGTVLVVPSFAAQVDNETDFEIHDIDPDWIKSEINQAIKDIFSDLCQVIEDESVETVSGTYEYDMPAAFDGDAWQLYLEPATDTNPWIKLLDWRYENGKLRFDYPLIAERKLRIIGIGYLSTVDADDDTTELDEPKIGAVYAAAILGIYRKLAAAEVGTGSERYQYEIGRWERETEIRKERYRTEHPEMTIRIDGWSL